MHTLQNVYTHDNMHIQKCVYTHERMCIHIRYVHTEKNVIHIRNVHIHTKHVHTCTHYGMCIYMTKCVYTHMYTHAHSTECVHMTTCTHKMCLHTHIRECVYTWRVYTLENVIHIRNVHTHTNHVHTCTHCAHTYMTKCMCTEKAMAPHSGTLAWKTPGMEEPGRLRSMGSLSRTRLSDFTFAFHFHALEKETATHSTVLTWRIPGTVQPVGLLSMGPHRVGHDWSNLAAAAAEHEGWKENNQWAWMKWRCLWGPDACRWGGEGTQVLGALNIFNDLLKEFEQ